MKRLCLLLLTALLCSCGTTTTTSNPAQAHAGTKLYRQKDGSLQIAGEWDYVVLSTTTDPPMAVVGGFKAHLVRGKAAYSHYVIDMVYKPKAGSFADDPSDITGFVKETPYTRAALDQAAQGAGITVPLPKYRTRQPFSAAYLRGFLQKVDETVRNPALPAHPPTLPWYEVH